MRLKKRTASYLCWEVEMIAKGKDIESLIKEMQQLTGWIKTSFFTFVPIFLSTVIGLIGYLIIFYVKG